MPADAGSDEYPRAPAQKARDENILAVFEESVDPVLTTAEVAAELPIGKRATLNRLEALVDRGELDSKDVGVGRVWWRPTPESGTEGSTSPGPDDTDDGRTSTERVPPDGHRQGQSTSLEPESPQWAFLGSFGRHSIYAGVFIFGLLVAESVTVQTLLPVPEPRLFLTAVAFFLIGFPARGLYLLKRFLDDRELSPGVWLDRS